MLQKHKRVKSGLDVLVENQMEPLKNQRVALLAHPASVNHKLIHIFDLCVQHQIHLVKLFGPEHGFLGHAQDMDSVESDSTCRSIPTVSLYGPTRESLFLPPQELEGVDVLVCDLQDVGARYYTFAYTIAFAMRACAAMGTKCIVLDRPNPIGGLTVEGNDVLPAFRSFVGEFPFANRHGLTMGELATLFQQLDSPACDLEVIWMAGWKRDMLFSDTGLEWVFPSPNMPTEKTALLYPGACLFEGTNLSEGRGTTKPFELIGAPYIDDPYKLADLATQSKLENITLRPLFFQPKFQKHANKLCGGVQIHIGDQTKVDSLRTSIALLVAAHQFEGFGWRTETYEFADDRLAIDLLFGDDKARLAIESGGTVDDVLATFYAGADRFHRMRKSVLHSNYSV